MTFHAPFEAMTVRIFVSASLRCEAYDMAHSAVVPARYAYLVRDGREYVPPRIESSGEKYGEEVL